MLEYGKAVAPVILPELLRMPCAAAAVRADIIRPCGHRLLPAIGKTAVTYGRSKKDCAGCREIHFSPDNPLNRTDCVGASIARPLLTGISQYRAGEQCSPLHGSCHSGGCLPQKLISVAQDDRRCGGKGVNIMLCVIIIVDPGAAAQLLKVEQIADQFGFPPKKVHGHITLATYTGSDEETFIASCKSALSGFRKFPIYYDKVEAWTSVSGVKSFIVAVPRKDRAIVDLQKEISKGWSADLNKWTREDTWNPHTSLIHVPGVDLSAVVEAMQREFEPFIAQIDRIEFTHVYETEDKCSFEIVDVMRLQ